MNTHYSRVLLLLLYKRVSSYYNYCIHLGQNKEWNQFVNSRISRWKKMITFWLVDWQHPVIVVTYEQLKEQTSHEIKKMLDFIGLHELSLQEIQARLGQGYR